MKFKEILYEGEACSKYYGYAWFDFASGCKVTYPIPFNIIFRFFRKIFLSLKKYNYVKDSGFINDIYRKGFIEGRKFERTINK